MATGATSQEQTGMSVPSISLPKGGGAIHGVGEIFSTNAMAGTASLTVPIAVTAGRAGFGPELSLRYDSTSGNGLFGMGWSLATPEIVRKTEKGLPRYDDFEESDVFILSNYEDLVPTLRDDKRGWWEEERDGFRIRRYRPRTEGLFARIERWTRLQDGDCHWRVVSKDNAITVYGDTPASRIADPEQPGRIFKWLVSASYDAVGNAIRYEYAAEDLRGVDADRPEERRRGATANRYCKRIFYGNRTPARHGDETAPDWMFEAVFDFGDEPHEEFRDADGDPFVAADGPVRDWTVRRDPFSSWRSGFEIRTYRLCRRVLMVHRFPEEFGRERLLVRSTEFRYDEKPTGALLTSISQAGYRWAADRDAYLVRGLPPLVLGYASSPLEGEKGRTLDWREAEAANLPEGVDGSRYRWIDLDGEGVAGPLTEQGDGWYFERNLGEGRFADAKLVARKPSSARLQSSMQALLDVGGTGQLDLVDFAPGAAGFYERARDPAEAFGLEAGWGRFRPFRSFPVLDWTDQNLRFVDVTGDGIADVLVTEDVALRWHPSWGANGFGPGVRIPAPDNEDEGARVVFSDPSQSIFVADMSGDGLSDIVRIRNGEVCYWPNRGFGHFGAKIVMGGAPWFEAPGLFDPRRLRLGDLDGSGTTDIVYLGANEARVYLNLSGNALSAPRELRGLPDSAGGSVSVLDFLGRGTACLVWSSPLPSRRERSLRYADLMDGRKPHLLNRIANNLGAETIITYEPSTSFYLADRAAGRPWLTSLPFPVQVVSRVETLDRVGWSRLVSSFSYHHGFYDPLEREFRGFGRVDRLDAETFSEEAEALGPLPPSLNEDKAWRLPPVLTRTWHHTGVFISMGQISRRMAHEYYRGPDGAAQPRLEDTILPAGLAPEEAREACRALKGTQLRQEIYALDGSDKADIPYAIAEANSAVRLLQARGPNRHSVFLAHAREAVSAHLERTLYEVDGALRVDPRITHELALEVDTFGNPTLSARIAYGRRFPDRSVRLNDADHAAQARTLAVATRSRYTNVIDEVEAWRTPLPAESLVHELTHLPRARWHRGSKGLLGFDEVRRLVAQAGDGSHDLPFQDYAATGANGPEPYQRLIGCKRMRYRADDLSKLLPMGELESLALPGESFTLVLTPELIEQVYGNRLAEPWPFLHAEGAYVDLDGDGRAWAPSGRIFYTPNAGDDAAAELAAARRHFFQPRRFRDAFGNESHVSYDPHDLSPVEMRDPLGNKTRARIDYRVMQPDRVIDPNGNRTDAAFDALGRLVGTAVMGKEGEDIGDSLEGFVADLPTHVLLEHLRSPLRDPQAILGDATTRLLYDVFAFDRTRNAKGPHPAATCSLARETHASDLRPDGKTRIQQAFCYSDGFGREAQHKLQAEPGPAPHDGEAEPRWVGSGWTIFNNKGKPVRQYEPFFSATHEFEFAAIFGVSSTLVYDPVGRVVATLNPNHTFEKTAFDSWRQTVWDANDTVLTDPRDDPDIGPLISDLPPEDYRPTWYERRIGGELGREEASAAAKAAAHAATPTLTALDPLGRVFLSVAHNRTASDGVEIDEFYSTRSTLDIQGNLRNVIDPLGRVAATYDYDVATGQIHAESADAGERWTLRASDGLAMLGFDSRHHRLRREYDRLRRPTALFWRLADGPEHLAERSIYGESQPDAAAANLRGRLHAEYDGAGIAIAAAYDFKGNLLRATRQLLASCRETVDWTRESRLEPATYSSETRYDALNRPVAMTAPDRSVVRPAYNCANLIERIEVSLKGADNFSPYVRHIEYNARGQRVAIVWGNRVSTRRRYDPLTTWLLALSTHRKGAKEKLQDLRYVYDPAGNIVSTRDDAWQATFFRNQVVRANGDYAYDAIYRLVGATGREHVGQAGRPWTTYDDAGRTRLPLPGDARAMRHYHERYRYDAVGNILELIHAAPDGGGWRRRYDYEDISANNRLTASRVNGDTGRCHYDRNGNMTQMSHLPEMRWDFKDQLAATRRQVVAAGGAATMTYYVYDASGQRARKVVENSAGRRRSDRIYLGGFEIYREYGRDGETVTLERTTLHVMDDKQRVALVEASGDTTTIRFQYANLLGSACLELDESGRIISYEEYYPYGATSFQAGPSVAEVSRKRYRFLGKERDEETGFSYHGARYYAPWLGRWISCDPAGLADGVNLYLYASASPLCLADLNGMEAKPPHPEDTDIHQFWPSKDPAPDVPESSPAADSGGAGFFTSVWNWIKNAASTVWGFVKDAASTAGSAIGAGASSAWSAIKTGASSAWSSIKAGASSAWSGITDAASWLWSGVKSAAPKIWNWAIAPLIRTATNAAFGAAIGFALGGVTGAIAGGIVGAGTGAWHAWNMAAAHSYAWNSAGGWAEFVADNTWSLPNSAVGSVWATLNLWNSVNAPLSAGKGKLVFDKSWAAVYATTFGNVTAGKQVPKHEGTHALQARLFGPLFYPSIIANYAINTFLPYWLLYHDKRYPNAPITNFGQYFSRGVYPHVWAEDWAYRIEGAPP